MGVNVKSQKEIQRIKGDAILTVSKPVTVKASSDYCFSPFSKRRLASTTCKTNGKGQKHGIRGYHLSC